ncbi:hypothetical protein [Nostoc sp.]|uniref:hypothetical protein n=1 Tax=Nostoc sp. TaxID=1180 RepID=UPI002FF4ED25
MSHTTGYRRSDWSRSSGEAEFMIAFQVVHSSSMWRHPQTDLGFLQEAGNDFMIVTED